MKKLFVCLMLAGCMTPQEVDRQRTKEAAVEVNYLKDNRTNLCFATWNPGWMGQVYVNVPCTPEVEKLISK